MQSALIFKILAADDWAHACAAGQYLGSEDDHRDGFIHLSSTTQVAGTFEKYFSQQSNLVLVAFDPVTLAPHLRWEASRGGALFPHYYGALQTELARWVRPILNDGTGCANVFKDLV